MNSSSPKSNSNKNSLIILKNFTKNEEKSIIVLVKEDFDKGELRIIKKKRVSHSYLLNELLIQKKLETIMNVAKVYEQYLEHNYFNVTKNEFIGPSLKEIFWYSDFSLSLSTICLVGIKLIKTIEKIHSKGIIHSNLKPSKILINVKSQKKLIISDFSKCYIKNEHLRKDSTINLKKNEIVSQSFRNVNVFSSINLHNNATPTFSDDYESIYYIILYLINGGKWFESEIENYNEKNYDSKLRSLAIYKITTSTENQSKIKKDFILKFLDYIKSIKKHDKINYTFLNDIYKMIENEEKSPYKDKAIRYFDWEINLKCQEKFNEYKAFSSDCEEESKKKTSSPTQTTKIINTNEPITNNYLSKYTERKIDLKTITEEDVEYKKIPVYKKIIDLKEHVITFKNCFNDIKSNSPKKCEEKLLDKI